MKQVKFGVSGHLLENPLRKWPEILHADVFWAPSELFKLWSQFVDCLILGLFWPSETGQIWVFQAFWSCSVDFPNYGDPLAEIGHIWGFWALSGEHVGVNVEGGRRHISDALRRILSNFKLIYQYIFINVTVTSYNSLPACDGFHPPWLGISLHHRLIWHR